MIFKTSKKCDDTENYPTTGVPKMFPTVATSLGNCIAAQGSTSKLTPLSCNYSGMLAAKSLR